LPIGTSNSLYTMWVQSYGIIGIKYIHLFDLKISELLVIIKLYYLYFITILSIISILIHADSITFLRIIESSLNNVKYGFNTLLFFKVFPKMLTSETVVENNTIYCP